ncbi:hypothetical protein B0H12DRAFT_1085666 [Mycena haematopus]|nr:hypothetical protein B0H12DRAFT_1085666 [Mycena haematopus]
MAPLFGQPDPNILKSSGGTDFHQFTFKSIGKEPELLKRISSYEEGVHYQYSPSPEPDARYQYSPSPEPQLPARNEARTRPSLLQVLTNQPSEGRQSSFSAVLEPFQHPQPAVESPEIDADSMVLQYPESSVQELPPITSRKPTSPPPSPPPPFVPDYTALKELHARLETAHKVLAVPPLPKTSPTPLPEFSQLSVIAANKAVHHSEKTLAAAKEALQASQTRAAISEHGVTAAQTVVDNLVQALAAARMTLEMAQKTLLQARQAAEEAQATLLSSRAAVDAAEETKRLLEEPSPRAPTPEPVNGNSELIEEMKKDLDSLRLWVEEQESVRLATATVHRDISQMREEEEASKMMMVAPDDTDTDGEVCDASDTRAQLPAADNPAPNGEGEAAMQMDEPRRLEEDAAAALVALAEQITTPDLRRPSTKDSTVEGKMERAIGYSHAEYLPAEALPANEAALDREATLRKQQEARREQVRIQKEQAQAAAALSILKERQDAVAKSKSAPQTPPPISNGDTQPQFGNVVARNTVFPSTQVKVKAKKSKPVSGGVKLGPDVAVKADPSVPTDCPPLTDPSVSTEPSPALERAAALGLRVRTKAADTVPSSKPKKTRNHSVPPISHIDPESPQTDDISAHRTGSDPGDIPIIPQTPNLPSHLLTDIQLMNLRFALQDEGITWEAISRSRPPLPGVKTEDVEDGFPSAAQLKPVPSSSQRPTPVNTPSLSAPAASVASSVAHNPPPGRKQLPKFNKSKPQTGNTSNSEPSTSSVADGSVQPQVKPRFTHHPFEELPAKAPPITKRSPPAIAPTTSAASIPTEARPLPRAREDSRPSNPGSGVSTPVPDNNGSSGRSLNERVSGSLRRRSPPRFARHRSPTPGKDRFEGRGFNSYRPEEPERFGRRTPPPLSRREWARSRSPPSDYYMRSPKWSSPEPARPTRSPSPLRHRGRITPPPQQRPDSPARRTFSADHAPHRPSAPAAFYSPRQDSPPKGPRHSIPRVPSQNQKRPREDEYIPQFHSQKRFKDDGRNVSAASSRSLELETGRPSLENRLGAAPDSWNGHLNPDYESQTPRNEGLLSRLSDPRLGRGTPRGRGATRGRANKTRGRGRGEVSLAERMY